MVVFAVEVMRWLAEGDLAVRWLNQMKIEEISLV